MCFKFYLGRVKLSTRWTRVQGAHRWSCKGAAETQILLGREMGKQEGGTQLRYLYFNLGIKTALFQAVQKWKAGPSMDKKERKDTFRLASQVELCLILILARGN